MAGRTSGSCARHFAVLIACVGVALTLVLVAASASEAPSFAPPRSYAVGSQPWSVSIGDLSGDGSPDLVTANVAAGTVSVLLNRGDGSFRVKRDHRTGFEPLSVAIGDLNDDGKPDLATANEASETVSVLLTVFELDRAGRVPED